MSPPNAAAGQNLLQQNGLIVRPPIGRQSAGGSSQQPLAYLDTTLPVPSAPSGSDILKQNGLILRPEIPRQMGGDRKRGGFLPSIMKGVVNSSVVVAPLAVMAAHRMMNSTRKKGGGKKEDWAYNREVAKEELSQYGKPSALNINKYAALKRKSLSNADDWLTDYIVKKRTAKKGKKAKVIKVKNAVKTANIWKSLVDRAKENLQKYGKPSGANTRKFASLRKKGENTKTFLTNFKTRKHYASPVKNLTARNEYKRNRKEAQLHLSQFGKPTVANVSKFVSLKRKGQAIKGIENAVKARAKPSVVSAVKVKPTGKSPPPDTLAKMRESLTLLRKKIKALEGKK